MTISTIIATVIISTILSVPAHASTYIIDGRSALGYKLLFDISTKDALTIRLDSGRDIVRQKILSKSSASQLMSIQQTSSTAIVQKYSITDLGTLGGTQSFAYGINDTGQVVGSSWLAGDTGSHAFLYSKGKMTDLYPLDSQSVQTGAISINNPGQIASGVIANDIYYPAIFDTKTGGTTILGSLGGTTYPNFNGVATSINNLGQAVGYSYIDDNNRHAFLYSDGIMTDIGSFGGYSVANAINDEGIIVGFASNLYNGWPHAFVYTSGVMTDISPVGDPDFSGSESYANDINNLGQVVGGFLTADKSAFHAFLYSRGAFTDLGSTVSLDTEAYAINDSGQVVGIMLIPYEDVCFDYGSGTCIPCIKYKYHAFFYENGKITDLNTLIQPNSGWELEWAFDINNRGQIVGYGLLNDRFRAFLLTPIPHHL